ncbi:MAG: hypothetical protein AAFO91_01020 [Bacteroidota bacterium]
MNFHITKRKLRSIARDLVRWSWLALLLFGCQSEPPGPLHIQFYHWQTVLEPDSLHYDVLSLSTRQELFVKVADFRWSASGPVTDAELVLADDDIGYRLQPVVFITNEVMLRLSEVNDNESGLTALAEDILMAAARSNTTYSTYNELQLDCDWTRGSAKTYFGLLHKLRQLLPSDVRLNCTVRLHQWRDHEDQGIPPVDRGILMAYNSGDLEHWKTENSILDTLISAQYLKPRSTYDLPLDLALPAYRWAAIYRRNELAYLVDGLTAEALTDTTRFTSLTPNRFEVNRSTYLDGIYCYKGDLIRLENSDQDRLKTTYDQLLAVVPRFVGQRLFFFRQGSAEKQILDFLE